MRKVSIGALDFDVFVSIHFLFFLKKKRSCPGEPVIVTHVVFSLSLLDKLINRQPVHINRPIRPPRALPILLIVQSDWDVNFLPYSVESGFVEIHLGNLVRR
jgi:hypothetical protein